MFTFAATPVMYVGLFVLFAWCTLWSAVELIRSTTPQHRVSNALHLVMSVVMLAMVPRSTYAALSAVVPVGVQAANERKGVMAFDITGPWGHRL